MIDDSASPLHVQEPDSQDNWEQHYSSPEEEEYHEYQKKKPSLDRFVEEHITVRDKIECWSKHHYVDHDVKKAKFFCLNDLKNVLTVETHIVHDGMKYLGCLK